MHPISFFRFSFLVALCFIIYGCAPTQSTLNNSNTKTEYASVSSDSEAAIASVHPLATRAGMEILNSGGNAIDAALAVAFALGVVDSHNSGVGGGCFILAHLANGEIVAIDGREMAPAAAHRDMYIVDGEYQSALSRTGALASGIPGSVAALYELQKLGGQLKFGDVLEPAIELAEEGFPIDKTLAARIRAKQQDLQKFPASAAIFLGANGEPPVAGSVLRQKDLANSYRALAAQGPSWFYRGEFARKVGAWMASNGGLVNAKDFARYQPVRRTPIVTSFANYSVVGFPPPSSGGVHVAQILSMLEPYDLNALADADRLHLIAEVMRRAFADRAYWLGDSDFAPVPVGLLHADYAKQRMQNFEFAKATQELSYGQPANISETFDKHTTHIATADKHGNWVAITTTLNTSFGSKVTIPGTGILLNNQMDDFSAQPGVANAFGLVGSQANQIEPGKRPLSSMSPTLVLQNGKPVLTLGAAGGPTIISQVSQALIYRLGMGYPIDEALAQARVHHQWRPDLLFVEPTVDDATRQALASKGHQLKPLGNFGATQAIELRNGRFLPVTEPRLILRNQ